jgi:hypothetical protein
MFHWTDAHSLEIDLHDSYYEPFVLEPVKRFGQSDDAVLVSVVFGKEDNRNARP